MSDSLYFATGYANQSREIFRRLSLDSRFDVSFCGWQEKATPVLSTNGFYFDIPKKSFSLQPVTNTIRVLPDLAPQGQNDFGCESLKRYLPQEKPDILWMLGDSFFFCPPSSNIYSLPFTPAKSVLYFPSDGDPLPSNCDPIMQKVDVLVSMSRYGQKQVIEGARPLSKPRDCLYIPHGTNTNVFIEYNADERMKLRQKWSQIFSQRNGRFVDLIDKFVLGVVARNQPRKMLPDLFKIFSEFSKDKQDVVLLMHSAIVDQGGDLRDYVRYFGIQDKVVYTGTDILTNQFSEKDLCEVYNLFDAHVSATSGEGWGLTTTESQSCGIPSIITDFTTTHELVTEPQTGIAVPVGETIVGQYLVDRAIVNKREFVKTLNDCYHNRDILKKLAKKCRPNAVNNYDYSSVVYPQWVKLFMEMIE